jgi:hypothetical protein
MSGQKISLQWRKHAIAMHKCTAVIDLAKPCCWKCLPMLLEAPIHASGELLVKTSKTYNLFIWYSNNTYFSMLKSSSPLKDQISVRRTNWFWSVSLELTLFLDFLKLFVKMRLAISFTGKKNHFFWTYGSKVMGV